jgi:hypothetical protein
MCLLLDGCAASPRIVIPRPLLLGSEKDHHDKSPGKIGLGGPIGGGFKLFAAVRAGRTTMLPPAARTGAHAAAVGRCLAPA